jgi:hypothetical protein
MTAAVGRCTAAADLQTAAGQSQGHLASQTAAAAAATAADQDPAAVAAAVVSRSPAVNRMGSQVQHPGWLVNLQAAVPTAAAAEASG